MGKAAEMRNNSFSKLNDSKTGLANDLELQNINPSNSSDDDAPKIKRGVLDDGWSHYLRSSFKEMLFGTKLNVLLICCPLAFASFYGEWG